MIKIFYTHTKLQLIITLILMVFQLSCEQKNNWFDYNEIDVVRTHRDSTYYINGKLLNGMIKKFDKKGNKI